MAEEKQFTEVIRSALVTGIRETPRVGKVDGKFFQL
jgi:hypothetical protein